MKKKYPHRVLPRTDYKKIVVDAFLDNFFLLRYALGDISIKKGDTNYARHFKASQFFDGLSVNLLSVFRKQDAAFKVLGSADDPQHQEWQEGNDPFSLDEGMLKYSRYRGFVGIKIKDLNKAKIDKRAIKIDGVTIREDEVHFTLEHAPTLCNFWHFNIHIEGINSNNHEYYLLRNEEGYKNSQLSKVAADLLHQIEDYVVSRKRMRAYKLPKTYYKNRTNKV